MQFHIFSTWSSASSHLILKVLLQAIWEMLGHTRNSYCYADRPCNWKLQLDTCISWMHTVSSTLFAHSLPTLSQINIFQKDADVQHRQVAKSKQSTVYQIYSLEAIGCLCRKLYELQGCVLIELSAYMFQLFFPDCLMYLKIL